MTAKHDSSDWLILAVVLVLILAAAVFLTGCDQPPKASKPIDPPASLTEPIEGVLTSVNAIPPLGEAVKTDAQRLTPDNVPTLAPRIERNADEIIDHARAAQQQLTVTQATSRENDKRIEALIVAAMRLEADNAKLREQVERERASGIRKVQLIVGGVSAVVLVAGVGLAFVSPKLGATVAAFGAVGIGIAAYFATIAAVAGIASIIGLVVGVGYLAHRNGWLDGTLRRVVQAIEGKAQGFATVKDVKAGIALATDAAFHAIVQEETRPAGK